MRITRKRACLVDNNPALSKKHVCLEKTHLSGSNEFDLEICKSFASTKNLSKKHTENKKKKKQMTNFPLLQQENDAHLVTCKSIISAESENIIGRDNKLAMLKNHLQKSIQEKHGACYLSGPPGTGKTLTVTSTLKKHIQTSFLYINCLSYKVHGHNTKSLGFKILLDICVALLLQRLEHQHSITKKETLITNQLSSAFHRSGILLFSQTFLSFWNYPSSSLGTIFLDEIDALHNGKKTKTGFFSSSLSEEKNIDPVTVLYSIACHESSNMVLIGCSNCIKLGSHLLNNIMLNGAGKDVFCNIIYEAYTGGEILRIVYTKLLRGLESQFGAVKGKEVYDSILNILGKTDIDVIAHRNAGTNGDMRLVLKAIEELISNKMNNDIIHYNEEDDFLLSDNDNDNDNDIRRSPFYYSMKNNTSSWYNNHNEDCIMHLIKTPDATPTKDNNDNDNDTFSLSGDNDSEDDLCHLDLINIDFNGTVNKNGNRLSSSAVVRNHRLSLSRFLEVGEEEEEEQDEEDNHNSGHNTHSNHNNHHNDNHNDDNDDDDDDDDDERYEDIQMIMTPTTAASRSPHDIRSPSIPSPILSIGNGSGLDQNQSRVVIEKLSGLAHIDKLCLLAICQAANNQQDSEHPQKQTFCTNNNHISNSIIYNNNNNNNIQNIIYPNSCGIIKTNYSFIITDENKHPNNHSKFNKKNQDQYNNNNNIFLTLDIIHEQLKKIVNHIDPTHSLFPRACYSILDASIETLAQFGLLAQPKSAKFNGKKKSGVILLVPPCLFKNDQFMGTIWETVDSHYSQRNGFLT